MLLDEVGQLGLELLLEGALLLFHDEAVERVIGDLLAAIQVQLLQAKWITVLVDDYQCILVDILAVLERENLQLCGAFQYLFEIVSLLKLFEDLK